MPMLEQEERNSSDEAENGEINRLIAGLFDDYVSDQIEGARRAAESCGCPSCRNTYKKWLEWVRPGESVEEKRSGDNAFIGDDGDGPPDINSGNLADWYSKDL